MAAYSGESRRIKNALMAIAASVQYDTGDGPAQAFQQVLGSNSMAFDGWPNVQVLPGDVTVDHPTTGEVDHAPTFFFRVRIPLEDTQQAQDDAYDHMYDLTDLLIDAIDLADHQQSLSDEHGVIAVTMMNATRGDWLEVPTNNGVNLVCDVNVRITYSKTFE